MFPLPILPSLLVIKFDVRHTAAKWPNFRPNNSKEAPKKYPWPEKIRGHKMQNLDKSGRKEA
jgi:hypothetical protein